MCRARRSDHEIVDAGPPCVSSHDPVVRLPAVGERERFQVAAVDRERNRASPFGRRRRHRLNADAERIGPRERNEDVCIVGGGPSVSAALGFDRMPAGAEELVARLVGEHALGAVERRGQHREIAGRQRAHVDRRGAAVDRRERRARNGAEEEIQRFAGLR